MTAATGKAQRDDRDPRHHGAGTPGKIRRPHSIRRTVILTAAALTTGAVIGTGVVSEQNLRRAVTREVEARLIIEARHLALVSTQALLSDYPELTLHPIANALKERQPELEMVLVVDHADIIQGHPDARRLGLHFTRDPELKPVPRSDFLESGETLLSDGLLLVGSAPVRHHDGRRLGTALVGLRRDYIDQVLGTARRQHAIVLGFLLALGIGVASFLMSSLLKPISVLRAGLERIGRGDLDTPVRLPDRTEIGMLADTVNKMARELKTAQVEMVERERLAHEVELARQIQASLLPNSGLEVTGCVVEGSNRAAAEVGGDYYDYFPLPDGKVGIAIADVSGKGLAGCMVMSMLSALLRACRNEHTSPSRLLTELDDQLGYSLQPGTFVTMFYGIFDPRTNELTHASAGHTPSLICRSASGRLEWVRGRGIPLGSVRGGHVAKTLQDGVLKLQPGDVLVQFTDGVNEAFSGASGEQFGFRRVEETVLQAAREDGGSIIAAVHRAVEVWSGDLPPADDETMVTLRVREPETSSGRAGPRPSAQGDVRPDTAGEAGTPVIPGPLMLLHEARAKDTMLRLAATLEDMARIQEWLRGVLPAPWREGRNFELLSTALHEVCVNIAEHGYQLDPRKTMDVWWVPGGATSRPGSAMDREEHVGCFVLLDQGVQFRADGIVPVDYTDPAVWKRGRGFGLDIIHRVMREVVYHPGTPEGNVTLLTFGDAEGQEELRYA